MFVVPLDNNFSQFLLGETVAVSSPLSSLSVNKCSCTEYGINLQEPTLLTWFRFWNTRSHETAGSIKVISVYPHVLTTKVNEHLKK